jgi:hypothetical protein
MTSTRQLVKIAEFGSAAAERRIVLCQLCGAFQVQDSLRNAGIRFIGLLFLCHPVTMNCQLKATIGAMCHFECGCQSYFSLNPFGFR